MKTNLLLLILCVPFFGIAQSHKDNEIEAVKEVIQRFFDSLEEQDTVLLKEVAFPEGQIWTMNNMVNPARTGTRFFKDVQNSFDPSQQFLESPLGFDIKIHKGLAMAWVPYEFRINGEFSHCGVDIFTLIKSNETWRIANISYTLERDDCDILNK